MLDDAVRTLGETEHPLIPIEAAIIGINGWISRMEAVGLERSMSGNGRVFA